VQASAVVRINPAVAGTALGFGAAPIGNLYAAMSDEEAEAAVLAAFRSGVRLFDTAPLYGHGLSEERLGRALRHLPRHEITVCTKVGRVLEPGEDEGTIFRAVPPVRPQFDYSRDGVRRSLSESLARLGLDRVDVVHVHDPDDHEQEAVAHAFPALMELRDEGVIGAVGAGMNQSGMLTRFVRQVDLDCVLVAGRLTLLDQSAAGDLLPACRDRDVAVIVGGVFNSGVLADPGRGATYDYTSAPAAVVDRAQRLAAVCGRHGVPLAAAAVQFPTRFPQVRTVLVGARSAAEVEQDAALFELPLPEVLWTDLQQEGLVG
jgi:D-threo-aldose 1-dehydrogenase